MARCGRTKKKEGRGFTGTIQARTTTTCVGLQGVRVCFHAVVVQASEFMYTCLPLCHIKESLDTSAVGVAGADDCGEGRALHITAVGRMAAHFIACLSALLRREPVLAC